MDKLTIHLGRRFLLVSTRREAMASAANCSVAWPAKGGGEPAIFRTALQSNNMERTAHSTSGSGRLTIKYKATIVVSRTVLPWQERRGQQVQAEETPFSFLGIIQIRIANIALNSPEYGQVSVQK